MSLLEELLVFDSGLADKYDFMCPSLHQGCYLPWFFLSCFNDSLL
jgi:hypothetical protein